MSKAEDFSTTPSGIPGLGDLAWGSHICQWVLKRDDLARALAPYFAAGLANNERCIWVTAAPYEADEARRDLEKIVPELDRAIAGEQLRIVDGGAGPLHRSSLDRLHVFHRWLAEERAALAAGHTGLRVASNTAFVGEDDWPIFFEHEHAFNQAIEKRRIVALCSYDVLQVAPRTLLKAVRSHQLTIQQDGPDWKILEI
jgi:two-component system, sensor histidine kinase PdtaS